MIILCFILMSLTAALWFFANEYPALFGMYVPTFVMKRVHFKIIVAVALVAAVFISGFTEMYDPSRAAFLGRLPGCRFSVVVVLASLIVLSVLRMFSVRGAAVYAFIGAFEAYHLLNSGEGAGILDFLLVIVAAPVLSMCISCASRYMLNVTIGRSHIHLITLSHFMRIAVIAGIVMTSFALGINWGGFMSLLEESMAGIAAVPWISCLVLIVAIVVMTPFMRTGSDECAGMYEDFSVYSVLSVGFSVSLTLLFFSYEGTASLLGLHPMPLSVTSLVFASIAGVEIARKSHLIEREEYAKEGVALIMTPMGAFLLTYVLLRLTGSSDESGVTDFIVIASAMLVLLVILFAGYVRRHRRQREITERLVYSQQQQIYENSRALNDMELKVVLSENQALHNAVEMKKQEVMNVALSIVEQKEYLESLNAIVKKLSKSSDEKEKDDLIAELGSSLKQRLSYDRDIDSQYFYAQAEYLHEDFNAKLSENFPDLTQQEKRLATLLRLGFSSKYIATLMNITPKSVEISRYRLRQKLGLSKGDNLVNYIKSI